MTTRKFGQGESGPMKGGQGRAYHCGLVKSSTIGVPPVLSCTGTHYDCFKSLGSTFKAEINYVFENYDPFKDFLLKWYHEHPDMYKGYTSLIQSTYPQYYDEVRGLADGSGEPLEYLFLLNLENEIRGFPLPFKTKGYVDHCTDIHVNLPDRHCIGHNEDGGMIFHNITYFVDFTLIEKGYVDEHFVSFCYPGQLPGLAFSYNKHGITFTMNALIPDDSRVGIPKFIVNRDVLSAETYDEIILKSIGVPNRAFGHSMNIASINEPRQMLIELATYDSAMREIIGNYSHMNNYRLLDIPFQADNSSTHRLARTFELPAPKDTKDIINLLGDTHDKVLPIYRTFTMATAIFDLDAKWVHIYNDNPKTSDPVLKWSLILE